MLTGKPDDWIEGPKGSGQWWRYDGEDVFGPVAIRPDWTPHHMFAKYANPPPPVPDPRDAEIADLKAGMAALKKSGVLTDRMIDAERVALTRKE